MPVVRIQDEEERQDLVGFPEMEVRLLRRVDNRALRRHGGEARGVYSVAALEGRTGGHARSWAHVQTQDLGVLGPLADARARRRVAPGAVRGRHMARPRPRRAHLL